MRSVLLRDGFSVARANARQRIENMLDLHRLFRVIDADPAIVGAGVVYIDSDFNVVTLRDFQPICSLIVKQVILREAPRYIAPQEFARELENNPRESRLVFEALGMGLSCVGAVISWSVLLSSTVLVPFTAGVSAIVGAVGYAAGAATTVQCFNSSLRVGNELFLPQWNDWLDSQSWYQDISMALDAVALAGAATTLLTTVRLVQLAKAATGKSISDVLRGLNRQERTKLTNELLSIRDPRLTTSLMKLRKRAGELPRRYTSEQMKDGTLLQIKDCVGAGLGMAGSALSGGLRSLAVGIYSELAGE